MNAEQFKEKFPRLLRDVYCGFYCPDGWESIIHEFCEKAEKHINNFHKDVETDEYPKMVQLKEKFGGLRIYMDASDAVINKWIDEAAVKADTTCETCGEPGVVRYDLAWVRNLCDKHHAEKLKKD